MSKRPTLEEVDDDIDNMDMDIAEFDPSLRTPIAPLRPEPSVQRSQDVGLPVPPKPAAPQNYQQTPTRDIVDPKEWSQEERDHLSKYQVVYPCYFDAQRSHKQGRRVSEKRAVFNPLATTILNACRLLRLPVLLELDKSHPQDFGNPGRVRVMIKDGSEGGRIVDPRFQNKRVLLNTIADYMREHPTTLKSIGPKGGIAYPPDFEHGFTPEEIPTVQGFRMNTIVPVHSPFTLKHPMTKSIYDPEPEDAQIKAPQAPKQPKKKVMKIRG